MRQIYLGEACQAITYSQVNFHSLRLHVVVLY